MSPTNFKDLVKCLKETYPDRKYFGCEEMREMGCEEFCCDSCHEDALLGYHMMEYEDEEETILITVCCGVAGWNIF